MAFVSAMSAPPHTKVGVNGETVYTEAGVGDRRLALFTMLNRGLEASYIAEQVQAMDLTDLAILEDLFVMAFQTRDVRGGKGERKLFVDFLAVLSRHVDVAILERMVPLIPEYGCWRDLWEVRTAIPALEPAILQHVKVVFADDEVQQSNTESISLLAKWLPREKSKSYPGLAKRLAATLFPDIPYNQRMSVYRRRVNNLNAYLETCEVDMCRGTWRDIEPTHVPGRALKLYNAAFLNKVLVRTPGQTRNVPGANDRFPDDADRVACRERFLAFLADVKSGKAAAKGANVVFPHEIVQRLMPRCLPDETKDMLEAQWASIRTDMDGLGKIVPMCDFSGSMAGLPMTISLALGILISELAHPSFRDHILTFDSKPAWHSFVGCRTLTEKLQSLGRVGQGLSTDFYKACMLVVKRMEEARVPVGEEPEMLLVLTDMGWDAAGSGTNTTWSSQIQRIQAQFREAGERVWGAGNGWKVPTIVVWNLRATYNDFQAKATDEGVLTLSGWSPNVLKTLQSGNLEGVSPMEGLRVILDNDRYDRVRATIKSSSYV
jgi:hypothetical protein